MTWTNLFLLVGAFFLGIKNRLFGDKLTNKVDNAIKGIKENTNPVARGNSNKDFWDDVIYFEPSEFDDNSLPPGSGLANMKADLVLTLDKARDLAQIPFVIGSGYRSPKKNKDVGGVSNSAHMLGMAADVSLNSWDDTLTCLQAGLMAGFKRAGVYKSKNRAGGYFIHFDVDDKNRTSPCLWYSNKYVGTGPACLPLTTQEQIAAKAIFDKYVKK